MMKVATLTEVKPAAATSIQSESASDNTNDSWLKQELTNLKEEMRKAINDQNWRQLGLIVDTYSRLVR